jgi:hypothetical protein
MDRYKEPGARNVCDGDWTALSNLMLQCRNHAARRSNHVAEPDRVHLGRTAIAQYDEFGYPLRRTHYADGSGSLIRRNEDHLLRPERARSTGNLMSSHHIGSRGGEWIRFHERNMLAGAGMQNDLRTMLLECVSEQIGIANVTDNQMMGDHQYVGIRCKLVKSGLGDIQQSQTLYRNSPYGAGKRRTDVARRAGDEDTLSLYQWSNREVVK